MIELSKSTDGLVGATPTTDPKVVGSNPGHTLIDFTTRKMYKRYIT